MSTETYTPPPAFDGALVNAEPPRGGWIKPVLIAVGTIVVLSVVVQGVFSGIRMFNHAASTQTAAMDGVSALRIDAAAGDFAIDYHDTDEALLSSAGTRDWELRREGDVLVVEPEHGFFGGCFGWCFGGHEEVTLTLPKQFESRQIDLDLVLSAGSFTADGAYGDLAVTVNAGDVRLGGVTDTLRANVNAGKLVLGLENVDEAVFDVNAGRVEAEFAGVAADLVDIDVSAGSLDLTVPSGRYSVSSDVSAGSFDNRVGSSSGTTDHLINVRVSAGSVVVSDGTPRPY